MTGFPHAVAINQPVGQTRSGIRLALLSVELWPHYLVLNLAGAEDDISAALIAEHRRQLAEWAAANPPQRPGRSRQPPSPRYDAMTELAVELRHSSDDLGWTCHGAHRAAAAQLAIQQLYRPHVPPGQLMIDIRTAVSSATVEITVRALR